METLLFVLAVVLIIGGVWMLLHKSLLAGVVLLIIGLLLVGGGVSIAHAAPPADPVGPIKPEDTLASIRLSASLVAALVGTVLPLINGFLTKLSTSSAIKGVLAIVLSAVNALITTAVLADGTAVISQQTALVALLSLVVSVATYVNLWRPLHLTSSPVTIAVNPGNNPSIPAPSAVAVIPGKLANVGVHD